jgi:hypothetical protein
MVPQNTRESALRREAFHQLLQTWLDDSFDARVGDPESHTGPAWLWVRHGGSHFYLNADSTRTGIRQYLHMVEENSGDPEWVLQTSIDGVRDRVAIGQEQEVIEGFEFYRHVPER